MINNNDKIVNSQIELDKFLRSANFPTEYIDFYSKWKQCSSCNLCNYRQNVVIAGGNPLSLITIIGEAPGPDEDINGIPFIGKSGQLLRSILDKLDIHKDVYFTNAVACIPRDLPNGPFRPPKPNEYIACSERLEFIWDNYASNSKVIILLGASAFTAFNLIANKQNTISNENDLKKFTRSFTLNGNLGWHEFPNEAFPKVYLTYHPSYIERMGRDKELTQSWVNDFKAVKQYLTDQTINLNDNRVRIQHAEW